MRKKPQDDILESPGERMGLPGWLAVLAAAAILAWLIRHSLTAAPAAPPSSQPAESLPPEWWIGCLPFAGLLAAIAALPLIPATRHWWESNLHRLWISLGCGASALGYALLTKGSGHVVHVLEHSIVVEYVPFMLLLFSLYVISGGVNIRGDLPAHPLANTAFLAAGALIASVVGTTGASMLLIRPLLQANAARRHVTHTVVFFIFLVSNIGGCLLPIGDPPLFLGFLRGVPFLWTLILWKEWAFCTGVLLAAYFIIDSIMHRRETKRDIARDERTRRPLRLTGWINFLWLGLAIVAVATVNPNDVVPFTSWKPFPFLRELILLALIGLSLATTPRGVHEANAFNYHAILEVAALFIGIFITMQIPLEVLHAVGGRLGLEHPWQFFWATGGLSSFLDNAPTYIVFFETADSMTKAPGSGIIRLLHGQFMREDLLVAISLGAVFMGANTYIGNGPNFMVKSIAEQAGVRMPSFFGYLFKYALPILGPLFLLVTWLFLL